MMTTLSFTIDIADSRFSDKFQFVPTVSKLSKKLHCLPKIGTIRRQDTFSVTSPKHLILERSNVTNVPRKFETSID